MSSLEILGALASVWTLCYPLVVLFRATLVQIKSKWKLLSAKEYDDLVAKSEALEVMQMTHEEAAKALAAYKKSG